MIARRWRISNALAALLLTALLGGCAGTIAPPVAAPGQIVSDGSFTMADGAQLPYRTWLPPGSLGRPGAAPPWAVVLALHGFNDSRDAWDIPAPVLAAAGVAVVAPDQRGFGATADRGRWPGTAQLQNDAAAMLATVQAQYAASRVFVMGESMGGAVAMRLAASHPPGVAGYILLAPAVWGRAEMDIFLRVGLFLSSHLLPGVSVTGGEIPLDIHASDNIAALRALSRDPLTLKRTRFDTLAGLVDLMDAAQAASPALPTNTLLLYGERDKLVPEGAMARAWEHLPPGVRTALYADGYHLLLRDLDRAPRLTDILAWMHDETAPLPSGADITARTWLAHETAAQHDGLFSAVPASAMQSGGDP